MSRESFSVQWADGRWIFRVFETALFVVIAYAIVTQPWHLLVLAVGWVLWTSSGWVEGREVLKREQFAENTEK
jgi:hypothetical protein